MQIVNSKNSETYRKCLCKSFLSHMALGILVIMRVRDTLVSPSSNFIEMENLLMMNIPKGRKRMDNVTWAHKNGELRKKMKNIMITHNHSFKAHSLIQIPLQIFY